MEEALEDKSQAKDSKHGNLLNVAIAHHNYQNIEALTAYIHPDECKTNYFITLFSSTAVKYPGKDNITKINNLLLERGYKIPSSHDLNNIQPRLEDYYIEEALQAIEKARNNEICIRDAFKIVKANESLTTESFKNLLKPNRLVLAKDQNGHNLLELAISQHHIDNIEFLLKHINPSHCIENCFIILLRGDEAINPDKINIVEITNVLVNRKCPLPSLDDLNTKFQLDFSFIKDAKSIIHNAVIVKRSADKIEVALQKARRNELLTIADLTYISQSDLYKTDSGNFNLLDWAIMHHSFDNIKFLLDNNFDHNKCKKNCFTRLFSAIIGDANEANITKITELLIEKKYHIPDDLIYNLLLEPYCSDAKKAIRNGRKSKSEPIQKTSTLCASRRRGRSETHMNFFPDENTVINTFNSTDKPKDETPKENYNSRIIKLT